MIKTTRRFYPKSINIRAAMCRAMKTLRSSLLIAKSEQWKPEDPSAKLHFCLKCDSNFEKEEEGYENSEEDEEEAQLKGIFFSAKLLQVLLGRKFYHWINVMPSKTSILFLEH